MKMVGKIIERINILLGTRFWYSITINYWVDGKKVYRINRCIGVTVKQGILDHRSVVGAFHEVIYNKHTKKRLNNGSVDYDIIAYLGWFGGGIQ